MNPLRCIADRITRAFLPPPADDELSIGEFVDELMDMSKPLHDNGLTLTAEDRYVIELHTEIKPVWVIEPVWLSPAVYAARRALSIELIQADHFDKRYPRSWHSSSFAAGLEEHLAVAPVRNFPGPWASTLRMQGIDRRAVALLNCHDQGADLHFQLRSVAYRVGKMLVVGDDTAVMDQILAGFVRTFGWTCDHYGSIRVLTPERAQGHDERVEAR